MARGKKKKIINNYILWKFFVGLCVAAFLLFWWFGDFSNGKKIILGATFSQPYAEYLGNDWRANYTALLDDLGIKHLRLVAYWDTIEKTPGEYDFTDLDWQVAEARARKANIILAFGRKVPRWPECYIPSYLTKETETVQNMALTRFIKELMAHYRNEPSITLWQVENEPFVEWFGNCSKTDKSFVEKEIALVRAFDARPILTTDSGELGWWYREGHLGDYFGTTLYQVVWNENFGYLHYYLFRPALYRIKALLAGINPRRVLIAELQAESWFPDGNKEITRAEQKKSMNPEQLRVNVELASRTGFGAAYLWGSEYWYWLKTQGDDSMWRAVRELMNESK